MVVWFFSVVLALQSALGAQSQPTLIELMFGRNVRHVLFTIEDRPPTAAQLTALAALVDVKEGAPLRMDEVRNSLSHLSSAGRYDKVDVIGTPVTAGTVDVLFKLEPRHPIDKLAFSGDMGGLGAAQLDKLVREQYGGAVPTGARLRNADAMVRSVLRGEGYLTATVTSSTIPTHNPDRATLMFQVSAGPRTRIAQTNITGTSPYTPDQIRAKTETTTNSPYRSRALDSKLASLRDSLKSRGYYQATARPQRVEFSADGLTATLTLQVDAGPRIRLEEAGCKLPSGKLEDYVPVQRESSADKDLLDDSIERLKAALRREGFWKAEAHYTPNTVGNELVITYTLECGQRFHIDRVDTTGNKSMSAAGVETALGIKNGDLFNVDVVEARRRELENTYRRLGYSDAKVEIAYEDATAAPDAIDGRVIVKVAITEGTFSQIAAIRVSGSKLVSEAELRALLQSKVGDPYDEATVQRDSAALLTFYLDRGFQTTVPEIVVLAAKPIEGASGGSVRDITLLVQANEGPQIRVAEITIIGNHGVSEQTIRDELTLHVGDPFSESARFESRRRISELGSFRRVSIDAEPLRAGETQAHLIVTVDEAPKTTIGYGGGVEADRRDRLVDDVRTERLEVRPRGFFDLTRRNLWGKNRSISFFTRASLRPTDVGHGYTFNEYQTTASYREHRAFHSDADFLVGATAEQAVRIGFEFRRREFNAELLRHFSPQVTVIGRYALDFTHLFNVDPDVLKSDVTLVDRLFPNVRLSILSSGITWDRRDHPLTPAHGTLVSADAETALRAIGSEVGYAKTLLQGSFYQSMTPSKRFIVAGRAQLGLAHPFGTITGPDGTPVPANLPASQRFFAGGGTTVRGFELDKLGVPEILNEDGLSNGGNGLVVLNAELRSVAFYYKQHPVSLVLFLDGGNVFANASDIDLSRLRRAAGFGLRGDTPLGSLRLDFGFKLDRRFIGGVREKGWEYHLSFGEAF